MDRATSLVGLETLQPAERLALVLHDVFAVCAALSGAGVAARG